MTKKGFGLGLAIAQMIVKRHHGSLDMTHSTLGGACFTIHLPLHKSHTDNSKKSNTIKPV
jgi:two-component system, OmpR family, sensor histidine kinase RstB